MSRVQPSRAYDALYGASFVSHCLTALPPRLPPRVDSPYPTLPLRPPPAQIRCGRRAGRVTFTATRRARRVVAWSRSPSPPTISPRARTFPRTSSGASPVSPVFPNAATRPPRSSQFGPPLVSAPRPPPTHSPFREVSPLALSPHFSQSPARHLAPGRHVSRDFRPETTGRSDASTRRAERSEATVAGTRARGARAPDDARPPPRGRPSPAAHAFVPAPRPSRGTTTRAPVLRGANLARARRGRSPRRLRPTPALSRLALERSARNPITANPRRRRCLRARFRPSRASVHAPGGAQRRTPRGWRRAARSFDARRAFRRRESGGGRDATLVQRMRAKRAFEASLPPLSDVARLPLRQRLMEEWEEAEWAEREREIARVQEERLDVLKRAIDAGGGGGGARRVAPEAHARGHAGRQAREIRVDSDEARETPAETGGAARWREGSAGGDARRLRRGRARELRVDGVRAAEPRGRRAAGRTTAVRAGPA